MPITNKITEEQLEEIKKYRKNNRDKKTDKRLRAIQLRGEGLKNREVAIIVESTAIVVSHWVCEYVEIGISALLKGQYMGNRRNMTLEEESDFISEFKEKAKKGEFVTVKKIKNAYCEKIGHICGKGQIYRVLKRQGRHKIVPRKEHPNKASEAKIEASKKN